MKRNPERDENNPIAKRIREAVVDLRQARERIVTPVDTSQERVVESIRTLARSRISNILRELRASSGYSYEELTDRTGLPKQLLFDVEFKSQRLTFDQLQLLARCYEVDVSDILGVDMG